MPYLPEGWYPLPPESKIVLAWGKTSAISRREKIAPRQVRYGKAIKDKVFQMHRDGKSTAEIAGELNLGRKAVQNLLRGAK